ncbi:MAG: peptide/nickel transport system substrate-binding protein [Chloroflexi bacterium]|nr:MAG: peptide/nickel transport system substrate-binding protein [Chloroflexota bacterium]
MDTSGIKRGGTLKIGMLSDHIGFEPGLVTALPDIVTIQHTYDVLVFRNPDLTLSPALAESWETNEDASQWTFNLRKGVKFSHGKEFKAEDVIFTINRMFEIDSPITGALSKPTAMVAVDDYTVRLEFDGPNAPLLDSLVKYHSHIIPSDVDPERLNTETIGTGPFVMTDFVVGERASFKANPNYWMEGVPYVDEMHYIFLPSPEARAAALKAGLIDMIYDLDASSIPTLQDHPDTTVLQAPSGGYMNLAMIVTEPPFDNKLVRKAVQAATDRQAILQGAQFGLGGIAYDHPVVPTDPRFNADCKPPDYSPELAKSLLAEAGYPNGIDLTLYTSTAGASMVEMATILKESFRPAGINLDIVVMPEDGYWAEGWLVKPFTTVWWGGRPPYEAFSVVYSSDAAWNESFWKNDRADALLKEALGAASLEDQKRVYGELQCLVIEEVPRIITVFRPVTLGVRNDVMGAAPMWDATMSVHKVWLDR